MSTGRTAREIVDVNWKFEGQTFEVTQAAAMLDAARSLRSIRLMLESLGHDGIHVLIRAFVAEARRKDRARRKAAAARKRAAAREGAK